MIPIPLFRPSAALLALSFIAHFAAADSPQWGGTPGRNMASAEKNLPQSFVPGEKNAQGTAIDPATTKNVRWAARLGTQTCSTPSIANGRVFIGFCDVGQGVLLCLNEATGQPLWRWSAPPRPVPAMIDGRKFWFGTFPRSLGVCSTAAIDGDLAFVVNHRLEVLAFDVRGQAKSPATQLSTQPAASDPLAPKIAWMCDMWDLGVRPSDACNCSVIVHGDLVYICTSNGVDRDADARKKDEFRKPPAPNAPSIIVLEKTTGRLVATDDAGIGPRLLHGQWSSPSLGKVGDKTLLFFGGGDGVCYAFETLSIIPDQPVKLKTAWSFDCNPPEYKSFGDLDLITHYSRGDIRRFDALNKPNDGSFVGMSEIIATPVFHNNRVYIAIGRDPDHGRGKGALWCLDPSKTGDVTATATLWSYKGLDRTLSTVSILDNLLFIADVAGRLHCLDADTGKLHWVLETREKVWGSTLAADGKVYFPTEKFLWILAADKEQKVLDKIRVGSPIWATPVATNNTLFIASTRFLWAVQQKQ